MDDPKVFAVQSFDPFRVRPLPNQPRKRFRGIGELASSIAEVGQATPGVVTLVKDDPEFDAQLVDGARRLRACKNLGRPFRAEVRPAVGVDGLGKATVAAEGGPHCVHACDCMLPPAQQVRHREMQEDVAFVEMVRVK